jgi:hypothetical protein
MSRGSRDSGSRLLEVMAVVFLAVATVGSTWCAFQASQWNGEESRLARESSDERVEASRLFSLGTQKVSYDTNTIGLYAEAVAAENENWQQFIRDNIARAEFEPVIDEWLAAFESGAALTPLLEDEEYISEQFAPYNEAVDRAESATQLSIEAGDNASDYLLTTLLIAIALFFAGVTTSFKMRSMRLLLLMGSGLTLAVSASRLAELPIL